MPGKRNLLSVISLLLITALSHAQTHDTTRLYGYLHKTTPGVQETERDFDESGKVVKKKAQTGLYDYKIYLTSPGNFRVYPMEMWINGQRHGVKAEPVEQTPVEHDAGAVSDQLQKMTLVPKTTQKVWLLTGIPALETKKFKKAAYLAKTAGLVVVYKQNGRVYYKTLEKFTTIRSGSLQ